MKHILSSVHRFLFVALLCPLFLTLCACGNGDSDAATEKRVVMSLGKQINTLDPALAADTTSQYVCGAFYDTLLQYHYAEEEEEYRLEPCMLTSMPEVSADGTAYTCTLRDDLYFQDGEIFANEDKSARKITARDVAFSILRLADTRLRSPGFWLVRDRIRGLEAFRKRTEAAAEGDLSPYDALCEGLEIRDDRTLVIHLEKADPRFLYALALPYTAVVSRRALEHYGDDFADHPQGSGPFRLTRWEKDYIIEMARYDGYHAESDGRTLPAADRISCYLVKQPLASWLMFLQGRLDLYVPDSECFEAVVNKDLQLSPALRGRGIRLLSRPQLETNYIGFNFTDPLLGNNPHLRRAITLAFDRERRIEHSGSRFSAAYGPVPPGVPGAVTEPNPELGHRDVEAAKRELELAGYKDGIDPKTGRALVITFDQTGSDTFYRQTAELMANDMAEIGIEIQPEFNTWPRFVQKLRAGSIQLFRYSWTADYPDAENFLQLFYGENAGGCNRVNYRSAEYDAMYREFLAVSDPAEYAARSQKMIRFLQGECPWIFETHTMCFVMAHEWLSGYMPHDFAFNRWKYLSVDPAARERKIKSFKPFSMNELTY